MNFPVIVTIILLCAGRTFSQENAGTRVATALLDCYNTTRYLDRNSRFPSTINVLVDIIRKIEDSNRNVDARELSVAILQTFKQDGIKKSREADASYGIPYSPTRKELYKNKILLTYMIPLSKYDIVKNMDGLDKCSLHFMISSTVDLWERGDENTVCRSLGRYRVRTSRAINSEFSENLLGAIVAKSSCPIEEGVVYSKWGSVKAGNVLSGIATGYNSQTQVTPPLPEKVMPFDNKYGSTIAGEIAEASLYQAVKERQVGCDGQWNSTLLPHYYFLSRNEHLEVTDAEIRGALDGLYLGKYIADTSERESLKISQIIDMYYSPRGLKNSEIKACNRSYLQTQYCPSEELISQTINFCYSLDQIAQYDRTYSEEEYVLLSKKSVKSLNDYIMSEPTCGIIDHSIQPLNKGNLSFMAHLNDLKCNQDEKIERTSADLIIFVDSTWDFNVVHPSISHILDNADINKYESSFTLISGQGQNIVNSSNFILDYYRHFNQTIYNTLSKGMDYSKVFQIADNLSKNRLQNGTISGGKSTVVIIVAHTAPNDVEKSFMLQRKEVFKKYFPDLKIIIVGSGSKDDYGSAIPQSDIFILSDNTNEDNIKTDITNVITRLKSIPRNVVNPKCGTGFSSNIPVNTFELTQFVEPQGINYYRIAPNYFYEGDSNRKLQINNAGYGDLKVCMSRKEILPKENTADTYCNNLFRTTSNAISYNIANTNCSDFWSCDPIYLSVEGVQQTSKTSFSCRDELCRFPDSIKFTIKLENVQCHNSVGKTIGNMLPTLGLFVLLLVYMQGI